MFGPENAASDSPFHPFVEVRRDIFSSSSVKSVNTNIIIITMKFYYISNETVSQEELHMATLEAVVVSRYSFWSNCAFELFFAVVGLIGIGR